MAYVPMSLDLSPCVSSNLVPVVSELFPASGAEKLMSEPIDPITRSTKLGVLLLLPRLRASSESTLTVCWYVFWRLRRKCEMRILVILDK